MIAVFAALLTLQVDVRADAALPCPAHAVLAEALRRDRGLRVEPAASVQAVFDWRAGAWGLELRRGPTVLLRRALTLPAADCALLADTAALVIDRYFSEVREPARTPPPQQIATLGPAAVASPSLPQHAAQPPPPSPLDLPVNSGESAPMVIIPTMPAALDDEANFASELPSGLLISAGLAALDDLRPGLWLQAERRWRSGTAAFLLVAGTADHDLGPVREASLQSALLAVSVGPCFDLYVRACVAPFAGVRGALGDGGRRSLHTESALRLTPELGGVVSVDRAVLRRLHLGVSVLAGKVLGEAAFDPAAPPTEVDLVVALRLGFAF